MCATIVHRHLGKVVAGAAIAVAGTAVMVGITLPGSAGADETEAAPGGRTRGRPRPAGPGGGGGPGVVERPAAAGRRRARGATRSPTTSCGASSRSR